MRSSLKQTLSACRQVKIWFQNRRSKLKKQNKQPDADSSSSYCIAGGSGSDTAAASTSDQASPHTKSAGTRRCREEDDDDVDDDVRRMYPPDSSIVYRPRELQSISIPVHPCSHRERVAPEPEANNVRLVQSGSKMHLMTGCNVDVEPARRRHDLLPAQQLVFPSLQLLSGFHPAAAAASESSSAWSVPPPVRDVSQQVSINYEIDTADSSTSSYLPWYSHHLMDSYNLRWRHLRYCVHIL